MPGQLQLGTWFSIQKILSSNICNCCWPESCTSFEQIVFKSQTQYMILYFHRVLCRFWVLTSAPFLCSFLRTRLCRTLWEWREVFPCCDDGWVLWVFSGSSRPHTWRGARPTFMFRFERWNLWTVCWLLFIIDYFGAVVFWSAASF